jgi:hypothetical protein
VQADPGLPGGHIVVVGVGEAGDLREAALVLDMEGGVAPSILVRGEGPSVALVVAGVGDLPFRATCIAVGATDWWNSNTIWLHSVATD